MMEKIFSGSQDGTIAIFQLEPDGYDFEHTITLDLHTSSITCLDLSWSHMYSGSDDGTVRVWCLTTYSVQRVLHTGSRIKCLYVDEAHEDEEVMGAAAGGNKKADLDEEEEAPTGFMYCGLSNGFVQKWRIGTWM